MKYQDLSSQTVNELVTSEMETVLLDIISGQATVTGGGKILRWSEFNENPDPLINEMLARILVDQIKPQLCARYVWDEMVVMSIENSATYLATAISYEIAEVCQLSRPIRIIRARKLPRGEKPSPALGNQHYDVTVTPITAGGESRHIIASMSKMDDFSRVKAVLVVDDFKATGSTLEGGVKLSQEMFKPELIIPMAALGKPDQEMANVSGEVKQAITALDVSFWWDEEQDKALIKVNGSEPQAMARVNKSDFVNN